MMARASSSSLVGLACLVGLAACNDSTAQNLAAAIAAEAKAKPAPSGVATAAASVAAATVPAQVPRNAPLPSAAPVALESLPSVPKYKQTNTYNGNVVYVPADCRGPYDVVLHFHGAHPYVKDLV